MREKADGRSGPRSVDDRLEHQSLGQQVREQHQRELQRLLPCRREQQGGGVASVARPSCASGLRSPGACVLRTPGPNAANAVPDPRLPPLPLSAQAPPSLVAAVPSSAAAPEALEDLAARLGLGAGGRGDGLRAGRVVAPHLADVKVALYCAAARIRQLEGVVLGIQGLVSSAASGRRPTTELRPVVSVERPSEAGAAAPVELDAAPAAAPVAELNAEPAPLVSWEPELPEDVQDEGDAAALVITGGCGKCRGKPHGCQECRNPAFKGRRYHTPWVGRRPADVLPIA